MTQARLFTEPLIAGLDYRSDYITVAEETKLLKRLGALPWNALLGAKRGLRNLLRRRRACEAREMKARQPHSVGGSKERTDVVEAAHVVKHNFYYWPGPSETGRDFAPAVTGVGGLALSGAPDARGAGPSS